MRNMDRTSWIGVIVCLVALFVWGWWSTKEAAKLAEERRIAAERAALEAENEPPGEEAGEKAGSESLQAGTPAGETSGDASSPAARPIETIELQGEALRLQLTNRGGSIETAQLLDHQRDLEGNTGAITINENARHGIGTLSLGPRQFDSTVWEIESRDDTSVTFATTTPEGLRVLKTYRMPDPDGDPYEIGLELAIRNDSGTPLQTGRRFLYAGCGSPLHLREWSMQIGFYWKDGKKFRYKTVDHFGGRKVLGIFGKSLIPHDEFAVESLEWAGVNDQFFTTFIKPETPYPTTIWGSQFPVVVENDEEASRAKRMRAAEAGIGLPDIAMNPGDQSTLRYRIYLGPKEFARLSSFDDDRRAVMHYDQIPIFGWLFGWAIKPLASLLITSLVWVKGFVGSFGLAIIIVTVAIRLLIWPIYAKSARSMKRMSKLTPMMKEIREKHGDDPQKMNEETMKLYRTYNINPLGGCLPMFIQLPVFLAFYRMLWSAVELRHESFLWVDDLAMPDTLFIVPGFDIPFNLLPILMGITSFIQIAMTPKTGDRTQQMIFMLMPFLFLFICYNFAAALSLYWTTSNAFSILQTWVMNKLPEPELKKSAKGNKKGFMQKLQEQAEAQQKARASGGSPGDRTRLSSERGERHTKGKKKKR